VKKLYLSTKFKRFNKHRSERAMKRKRHGWRRRAHLRIVAKHEYKTLVAPSDFSMVLNPEETLDFFSDIIRLTKLRQPIDLDLSAVSKITPETILYVILLLQDAKSHNVYVKGNAPKTAEPRAIFINSGFYDYVHSHINRTTIKGDKNVLAIHTGNNADVVKVEEIIDFVRQKMPSIPKRNVSAIYDILVEAITNTRDHADTTPATKHWWMMGLYEYYENKTMIRFAVVDDGIGIVHTVQKKWTERILQFWNDADMLERVLNGDFSRSRTKMPNRGMGLVEMKKRQQNGLVEGLVFIANKGYYRVDDDRKIELPQEFIGSIVTWNFVLGG